MVIVRTATLMGKTTTKPQKRVTESHGITMETVCPTLGIAFKSPKLQSERSCKKGRGEKGGAGATVL